MTETVKELQKQVKGLQKQVEELQELVKILLSKVDCNKTVLLIEKKYYCVDDAVRGWLNPCTGTIMYTASAGTG